MKLDKQDWLKLQPTLIILAVVLITALGLSALAHNYSHQQEQALQKQQVLLSAAKQRYQFSSIEKNIITEYLPRYQVLINKGFVGEERRLEWVSDLRAKHQNYKLFSIKYNIGLQAPYQASFASNMGDLVLNRSIMALDLDMLHEEDILQLTEALAANNDKVFILRDCEITKLNTDGVLSKQLIANLHAKCELDWLTLRKPAPIQVLKP